MQRKIAMNKEEIEIIRKFFNFRGEKWKDYIEWVDPISTDGKNELNVKTRELMRGAFIAGLWLGVNYEKDSKDKE